MLEPDHPQLASTGEPADDGWTSPQTRLQRLGWILLLVAIAAGGFLYDGWLY